MLNVNASKPDLVRKCVNQALKVPPQPKTLRMLQKRLRNKPIESS